MEINHENIKSLTDQVKAIQWPENAETREEWLNAMHETAMKKVKLIMDAGFTPNTVIPASLYWDAYDLRIELYNPADFGKNGKLSEIRERIYRALENGRSWMYWKEFNAHKQVRKDLTDGTENKAGAGNWLYSKRYDSIDEIIAEYRKKKSLVRWEQADEFCILCTWSELFDYLASYNKKGLSTWFKKTVTYSMESEKYCVQLQTYQTSSAKMAYLKKCPYQA